MKPQFPSFSCIVKNHNHLEGKFYEIAPNLQDISLLYSTKIQQLLDRQNPWQKFPKLVGPTNSINVYANDSHFRIPSGPNSENLNHKFYRIKDHTQCWLTILFYLGPFGVFKIMNKPQKNWCMAEEHYSHHLSLNLVGLVHHVGPQASNW